MAKTKSKKCNVKRGITDTRASGSSLPEQRDSAAMSSDRKGGKSKRVSFSNLELSSNLPNELLTDVSLPKFQTPFRHRLRIAMLGLLMQFLLCVDATFFDFWFLSAAADQVVQVGLVMRKLLDMRLTETESRHNVWDVTVLMRK